MAIYDDSVTRDGTVPGPAQNRTTGAGPQRGMAHDVPPEPCPPDHVQHSVPERLDFADGELKPFRPGGAS